MMNLQFKFCIYFNLMTFGNCRALNSCMQRLILLLSIGVIFSTCRKDPYLTNNIIDVYVEYTDSMQVLSYAKIKDGDTIEWGVYHYLDSQVYVEQYTENSLPTKHRLWYYFLAGARYAWRSVDTTYVGNSGIISSVMEYRNVYDNYSYPVEIIGWFKRPDSAGILKISVEVFKAEFKIEQGNIMSYLGGVKSFLSCRSKYTYSNAEAWLFADNLLNGFIGKSSSNLPSGFAANCYYGHGEGSPVFEYEYKIVNGTVVQKREIATSRSYPNGREQISRLLTRYNYYYFRK